MKSFFNVFGVLALFFVTLFLTSLFISLVPGLSDDTAVFSVPNGAGQMISFVFSLYVAVTFGTRIDGKKGDSEQNTETQDSISNSTNEAPIVIGPSQTPPQTVKKHSILGILIIAFIVWQLATIGLVVVISLFYRLVTGDNADTEAAKSQLFVLSQFFVIPAILYWIFHRLKK